VEKRLKILFLDFEIPYLLEDISHPIGGSCIRMFTFSKGLIELGHKVGILTWKGANALVRSSCEIELVETYSPDGGIRKLRWFYLRFPKLFLKTKSFKPDIFICKSPTSMLGIMSIICFLLRVKLVFMVTNDVIADNRYIKKQNKINQILFFFGLQFSHAIFCQNQYQFDLFKKRFPKKYIFKITNPFFSLSKAVISTSSIKREYVAWIGIFQYQKNLPTLLKIVLENPDIKFKIAGSESPSIDQKTKLALEKLKVCINVSFVDYLKRSEIPHFLSKAFVLLNTSHYEGFSNTFLEAFAVGTPVISLGVNPDNILTKYNLGFVTDEKEVGEKIKTLKNDAKFKDLNKRTVNYLHQYHDYKQLSMKLSSELLKVLHGRIS